MIPVHGLRVQSDFPNALQAVSDLMDWGEGKHPDEEWKGMSTYDHAEHAKDHCDSWLWEDPIIDEESGRFNLVHAACRLLMAIEVEARGKL